MTHQLLIENTINFVKETLQGAEAGHDWFHVERVWKTAKTIAKTEKADEVTVELASLLHDIADAKFHDGDEEIGPVKAKAFLLSAGLDENYANHIANIIRNISFKGGQTTATIDGIELAIVKDADRLDAIGAIGIARAFHYGGYKNRELYNPAIPPQKNMSPEQYRSSTAPTINHFYEKLLLLKDLMHTETGRQMAQKRHDFMLAYLEEFYEEWNGGK
jgi:uncharacterized protein